MVGVRRCSVPSIARARSGVTLLDVVNRGMMTVGVFHLGANRESSPDSAAYYGDALLLRRGLTVVMLGWQWDILPSAPGLHFHRAGCGRCGASDHGARAQRHHHRRADAHHSARPRRRRESRARVSGVRYDRCEKPAHRARRSDRAATSDPAKPWRFAREDSSGAVIDDSRNVYMRAGFEAGKIYEVVYRARIRLWWAPGSRPCAT